MNTQIIALSENGREFSPLTSLLYVTDIFGMYIFSLKTPLNVYIIFLKYNEYLIRHKIFNHLILTAFLLTNGNGIKNMTICSKWITKTHEEVIDIVLISLFTFLNKFHALLWCFQFWLCTSKCLMVWWA